MVTLISTLSLQCWNKLSLKSEDNTCSRAYIRALGTVMVYDFDIFKLKWLVLRHSSIHMLYYTLLERQAHYDNAPHPSHLYDMLGWGNIIFFWRISLFEVFSITWCSGPLAINEFRKYLYQFKLATELKRLVLYL